MTLNQILGYRAILMNFGTYGAGCMEVEDYPLFEQWLTSSQCGANTNRQVLVFDGDSSGEIFANSLEGAEMMQNVLGASLLCRSFNGRESDPDCQPEEPAYCVRYLTAPGGAFGTEQDVDAYGNGCPSEYGIPYGFDVLGTTGTGVGNRYYSADGGGGKEASYAQVVNENLAPDANYRTVITGVSAHHLTLRNGSGVPDFCPRDTPSIVAGAISEIGAALRWGFGVADNASIPKLTGARELAICQGTWQLPTEVGNDGGGLKINRLYASAPNPFNPRTTIKFSLAATGPVTIVIYGVDGRRVRVLVDEKEAAAGMHEAVWDGADDRGSRVGSGVYWMQMQAGTYTSNRKMIMLK